MSKHYKKRHLRGKIYKSLCKALRAAFYAGFNAQKAKTIDGLLSAIPFYCTLKCICRILKFTCFLQAEPCRRKRAEMLCKAILDVIKAKTTESIEEIILEILATLGLNLKPFWHLLKPAICAFVKNIYEDIQKHFRDKK